MPVAPEYLHLVYPDEIFYAYLYGRASHDPTKKGRSVGTQLHEGRGLCDQHSWPIVGVFDKDVDRSASRHAKKKRDDFEAMLEGIAAKQCRIVVAWEASRYYRDLEVYVRLRNACYEAGVLLCYNGVVYDLSKREDRKATAQDALQAEDEAEGIRDRSLRTQRRLAEQGRPGGRTPFGYQRRYDPDTGDLIDQFPHPVQAQFVTESFKRFASGETTYGLKKWLNSEPSAVHPTGEPWSYTRINHMLRNVAYIGKRLHQGKIVGDATWDPLIDEVTFHQVQRRINDPARLVRRDSTIRHLLSHIALCGECEEQPHLTKGKRNGKPTYFCSRRLDTAMMADRFDAYVEEAVIQWLKTDAALEAFQPDDQDAEGTAARARLEVLEEQLREARDLAGQVGTDGKPLLSVLSLASLENQLTPQIDNAKAEVEASIGAGMSPLLRRLAVRSDTEAAWEDLLLPQKRAVLREIVTIRLFKAHVRGAQQIRPGRITLSWVGQPGFISG